MKRITTDVPPPLADSISEYQNQHGYENRAQAVRALIRKGLNDA